MLEEYDLKDTIVALHAVDMSIASAWYSTGVNLATRLAFMGDANISAHSFFRRCKPREMSWTAYIPHVRLAFLIYLVGIWPSDLAVCAFLHSQLLNPKYDLVMLCKAGDIESVQRYLDKMQHAAKPPLSNV